MSLFSMATLHSKGCAQGPRSDLGARRASALALVPARATRSGGTRKETPEESQLREQSIPLGTRSSAATASAGTCLTPFPRVGHICELFSSDGVPPPSY
jgi:hypothetical protein